MIRRISALIVLAWLVTTGHGDDTPGITLIPRGPGEITVKENRYTKLREKATIDQQLGAQLSPDINFLDHEGKPVRLGDIPKGRPVLLVPAYYRCRLQCNMVLMGVFDAMKKVKFKPGEDFEIVGDTIGYRFIRDSETGDILHGMGICFLTPDLKISHYRMGMNYPPFDVQKDLQLASENGIGTLVDKLAFVCMKYDPHSGQYSWAVIRLVQAAAVVTIIALAFIIFGNMLLGRKADPARVAPAAGS